MKKFLVIALALILAMGGGALLTFSANAAQTVTETCTLPCKGHNLIHNFGTGAPDMTKANKVYCSVCGIAYREVYMESFHPEGAPDGVSATRPVVRTVNLDKGTYEERCTVSGCTATGPHFACACDAILRAEGESHNRTHIQGPNTSWVCVYGGSTNVTKGTWVYYRRGTTDVTVAPVSFRINGEVVAGGTGPAPSIVSFQAPTDGLLEVVAEGWFKVTGSQSGTTTTTITPSYDLYTLDLKGWDLPLVQGAGGRLDITTSYTDVITTNGSVCEYTDSNCTTIDLSASEYWSGSYVKYIKADLTAGQRVRMIIQDKAGKYTEYSKVLLTDMEGNVKAGSASASVRNGTTSTFLDVKVPANGTYYIIPCHYTAQTSIAVEPASAGPVSLMVSNIMAPSISVTASPTSVSLEKGSTSQLSLAATPTTATIICVSSNSNVASVTNDGKVTGIGAGSCTVTVTAAA